MEAVGQQGRGLDRRPWTSGALQIALQDIAPLAIAHAPNGDMYPNFQSLKYFKLAVQLCLEDLQNHYPASTTNMYVAYKQKDFLFEINILFITLTFPIPIEVKKVFKICIFEPWLFEYLSVKLESNYEDYYNKYMHP